MDITGIDKAKIVAALYNGSRNFGGSSMTLKEAEELLNSSSDKYFDYVDGRVMKIGFERPDTDFETWLYNRDNGEDAAERLISQIK